MNILYINATARKNSRTDILAQYILQKYNQDIEEVNLSRENIKPLDEKSLEQRENFVSEKTFNHSMFKYAKQFAIADKIIIAAPYWDLSFPAILKTYFEAINVCGITFQYSKDGNLESLCRAKELIYITASGGNIVSDEYGFGYVKALSQVFYGIDNIKYIKAEGLDILGTDTEAILNTAKKEIDNLFKL